MFTECQLCVRHHSKLLVDASVSKAARDLPLSSLYSGEGRQRRTGMVNKEITVVKKVKKLYGFFFKDEKY